MNFLHYFLQINYQLLPPQSAQIAGQHRLQIIPVMHCQMHLFLLILLFLVPISLTQNDDCSPSLFTCGNTTLDISYPFRVSNRPAKCSHEAFQITCVNNSPQIEIESITYQVKGIDYKNRTLTIVNSNFVGESCPLPSTDPTPLLPLFSYTDKNQTVLLYYNCSTPIQNRTLEGIPCPTNPGNYAYFNLNSNETEYRFTCKDEFFEIESGSRMYKARRADYESHIQMIVNTNSSDRCPVISRNNTAPAPATVTATATATVTVTAPATATVTAPAPAPAPAPATVTTYSSLFDRNITLSHNVISRNTTANSSLFDYTDHDRNITLYHNCSTKVEDPAYREIPCLTNARNSAYYSTLGIYPNSSNDCQVSIVWVSKEAVDRLEMNRTSFGDALKEGFSLTWNVGREICSSCVGSGGYCGYNTTGNLDQWPTCFCSVRPHRFLPCSADGHGGGNKKAILIGVAVGGASLLLLCLVLFTYRITHSSGKFSLDNPIFFQKKKEDKTCNVEAFLKNHGPLALRRYSYSELKKMTKSFRDKLGQGGFGGVFKGKLQDGRLVAVKVLNETKGNGEEFINEVASIGRTYHVNIVTLLGFCANGSKRALIYEFMPNGSLDKFIYTDKPNPLGWEKLYQITVGIARGLEYLHRGCHMRILHLDIKPHNILLDQDFCPKISDFGLAKLCLTKDSIVSMLGTRGTVGYIAPEVVSRSFGGVSHKSDAYSYGMMVLEIVGGRKNVDTRVENSSEIYFPHWIYKHFDLNGDLGMHGVTTEEEKSILQKMILVGLWCIQTNPTTRPSMTRVVEMLEGSLEDIQMPPKPLLSSPTISRQVTSTISENITEIPD